jgi:hypothetical protein
VTRGFFAGHPFQELYLRENDSTTTNVSASQRTVSDPNGPERNIFWTASSDGSRVFFTSPSELTDDANTGVEELPGPVFEPTDLGNDLYEYDVGAERLTDLSVDESSEDASTGADVLGVIGTSTDGSYVYFVAKGALVSGAASGKANLYMSHEGVITFIASLDPAADSQDWTKEVVGFSARISPDGKTLAFTSVEPLTDYDNTDAHTGERDSEVFVYRADATELTCASCNPSGSRPIGPSSIVSKGVPLWATSLNRTLTRNVSDNGSRIFFNSQDALAPRDTNDKQDVYVYEDERPYLLSSGLADQEAYFGDASASGDDVFIGTRAQLLESDGDEFGDLYDVRVSGGRQEDRKASECLGDSCRSDLAGTLPEPTIGSSGFEGEGNPNARSKCVGLGRQSKRLRQQAQFDLRRARHQSEVSTRLKLHRQAVALKRKAKRLARQARRCLASGGGKK